MVSGGGAPPAGPDPAAAGEAVLAEAVRAYSAALGPRLRAAYALGSLAHGGFSPLVSDVDLGLILADPVAAGDDPALQEVADAVRPRSELHARLSVFWATPATLRGAPGGRFPPLDRLDLLRNGRLLAGRDERAGLPRPDGAELVRAGAEFALDLLGPGWSGAGRPGLGSLRPGASTLPADLADPAGLLARGPRQLTKTVLFPVRFLHTARTGEVGTNEAAARSYAAGPAHPSVRLVQAALRWRSAAPEPAEAEALLRRELLPLYLFFVADHAGRLAGLGRPDLAAAYRSWHAQLLGIGDPGPNP